MSGLTGALCVGKWWLFESVDLAEHREAAELCARCPAIEACRAQLREELTPVGTWAGELVGTRKKRLRKPINHGTSNGYYQHRNRREPACPECLEAMRSSTWLRRHDGASA